MTAAPAPWLRWRVGADRVVAAVVALLLAPVVVALAALVLVVDRQRPLVGLVRIGQDGRPFTMWKLRTMRPVTGADGSFTVRDDRRVTALGRHLRRLRLDEVPQLWNVVRGEMALLGPRPEAPEHVDPAAPAWQDCLVLRPGIAGPTQVVIHGWEARLEDVAVYEREVLPHKLAIDRWYGEHASPMVDLEVVRSVLRTVVATDHRTAIHRRLDQALPATMAAVTAGTAP